MPEPPWLHHQSVRGPGPGGPTPREMYRVDTLQLSIRDAKKGARRPVVVLQVVRDIRRVMLCTRTSLKEDGSGVFHPATAELDLNMDGWFRQRWYQSADLGQFVAPIVELLGLLDTTTYDAVLAEVSR